MTKEPLIYAMKPGHDGQIAAVCDGRLLFSMEAEKDSYPRYETITPAAILDAGAELERLPDVVAIGGWVKGWHSAERQAHAGYFGLLPPQIEHRRFFGHEIDVYSATHERSHIYCAYAMSPYPQGQPVYCLVWEGNIGDFYLVDEAVRIHHVGHVMTDPGNKYSFLFTIADPSFPPIKGHFRFGDAGKLMALAAFSDRGPASAEERELIDFLLARDGILLSTAKEDLSQSPFYDVGVTSPAFKNLAGKYSDAIFEAFHAFARQHLDRRLPLLISGGCGLNCEWNSRWLESGLFDGVFVPPCTNDTGSGIGTAIDAQHHYTGSAKVDWDVYCGQDFVDDDPGDGDGEFDVLPLDLDQIAVFLRDGGIIGWARGRCEIGPRALGNRSILAAPFSLESRDRLNALKRREDYRPIAPICLEEDAARHFDCDRPSPYMLFFHRVRSPELQAVTHVDGSARTQTVSAGQNPAIHGLLQRFKEHTGFGVLCNTSLNFNGRGFINRTSDLRNYCREVGLDGFVAGERFHRRRSR